MLPTVSQRQHGESLMSARRHTPKGNGGEDLTSLTTCHGYTTTGKSRRTDIQKTPLQLAFSPSCNDKMTLLIYCWLSSQFCSKWIYAWGLCFTLICTPTNRRKTLSRAISDEFEILQERGHYRNWEREYVRKLDLHCIPTASLSTLVWYDYQ